MAAVSGFTSTQRASHPDPIRRAGSRAEGGPHRRTYLAALACLLLAALCLQLGLFGIGFHRVSFDERARSLMALGLSATNALEPYIWPPFHKLFVGSFLKLWGDVFLVPRLLVGAAGLLVILALVRLSDLLFGDRWVNLLSALLAVAFPHRLIFSVAPLSDIYAYLFLLLAAGCVLAWLRLGSVPQLLLGCACLFAAQTVRFEVGAFAAVLFPLVLHRWLVRRALGPGVVAAAAVLLFAFPAFWIADTWLWYGTLDGLGFTGKQYADSLGTSRSRAMYLIPSASSGDRFCPGAPCDGGEALGRVHQPVPSVAARLHDGLVAVPDAVAQEVGAQVGPDLLDRVRLRGVGRQPQQADVLGDAQPGRGVPARPVQHEHGVGALGDTAPDLGQVRVHGLDVDVRQHDGRAHAALRADRAEQPGPGVAAVAQGARQRAPLGPNAGQRALLADTVGSSASNRP